MENNLNKVKIVILCGGLGTRIFEETKNKPKPMIKIDNEPILVHILNLYRKYDFKNFSILLNYMLTLSH